MNALSSEAIIGIGPNKVVFSRSY